jgi:hypothetical protein
MIIYLFMYKEGGGGRKNIPKGWLAFPFTEKIVQLLSCLTWTPTTSKLHIATSHVTDLNYSAL